MRKHMRQEQVYRCDKLQPGTGIQCGMYADHDDDCTVLIPTGAPWFPGREQEAPDAPPEPATTDEALDPHRFVITIVGRGPTIADAIADARGLLAREAAEHE